MKIPGNYLVRGSHAKSKVTPLLPSDVSLSFWGGVDPVSAIVIDSAHPLAGQSVEGRLLCLPSARGSCTASQVLLELILNRRAPSAIVLRDVDGLACVGALIADEIFCQADLDILQVGEEGFRRLLASDHRFAKVTKGHLILGDDVEAVDAEASTILEPSADVRPSMHMTKEEEHLLDAASSEAERMALGVLFRYARLVTESSPEYTAITNAHIDGCTYIGPGGLAFVRQLVDKGGQVKVPTTLNSVSTDRQRWKALGVPEIYAKNSIALGDGYLQLGCQPSFTCAPYLLSSVPKFGQDIAWGESNAVVYANTVVGARTEKYADYLDICCALAGVVPLVGVHQEENRRPQIVLDASALVHDCADDLDMLFPLLGHLCGSLSDGKVPILIGMEDWRSRVNTDHLKAFCAAFGTTGSSPLIHIDGITPEALDPHIVGEWLAECGENRRIIQVSDLQATFETLDSSRDTDESIQLVALGNPHLSASECTCLAEMVKGQSKHPDLRMIACISRAILDEASQSGSIQSLQDFGVEFVSDTCWCMLLDPPVIPADPNARILTNSGKYSHYGPGLTNRTFRFGSLTDCVGAATTGVYRRRAAQSLPGWMSRQHNYSTAASRDVQRAVRMIRFCM